MSLANTRLHSAVGNSSLDKNMTFKEGSNEPMTKYVSNISPVDGGAEITFSDGTIETLSFEPKVIEAINVSPNGISTGATGSEYKPFKSIVEALPLANYGVLKLWKGQFTENLTFSPDHLTINTDSDESSYRTKIIGDVTISSPVSSSISNLEIEGNLTINMSAETSDRSASLLYFNNVAVNGITIITGTGGYLQFDRNCEFMDNVIIEGGIQFKIKDSQFEGNDALIVINAYAKGIFDNAKYVTLVQNSGIIESVNGTIFHSRGKDSAITVEGGSFMGIDGLCINPITLERQPIKINGEQCSFGNFICDWESSTISSNEIDLLNIQARNVWYASKGISLEEYLRTQNRHVSGDLSTVGQTLSFSANGIDVIVERKSTSEMSISLSSETVRGVSIITSLLGSISPEYTKEAIAITDTPTEWKVIQVGQGTYIKAEFDVILNGNTFHITAAANDEYTYTYADIQSFL